MAGLLFCAKHKINLKTPAFSLHFSEKGNMMILSKPSLSGGPGAIQTEPVPADRAIQLI